MAISLNNHEDRITVLEQSGNINPTCELILNKQASGNLTTTKSMNSFDFLFISTSTSVLWFDSFMIPYSVFKDLKRFEFGGTSSAIEIRYVNDNTIYANGAWIHRVYGLKLYYSFSYNIIYKILLRKISRLCQKFTPLKRKECGIIWL